MNTPHTSGMASTSTFNFKPHLMESKIHTYESDEITVTYDIKRCIHAAECVRGLPMVFKPELRRWIQPENSTRERIADVIERCPTGALHYEMKTSTRKELPLSKNRIQLQKDGPIYFFGDLIVQDAGGSSQKPFCDGTHRKIDFKD